MYYFPNENHEYILFLDTEFDGNVLIQFCGLLFRKVKDEHYVIYRSMNSYINYAVSYQFQKHTGISRNFLENNGVRLFDVQQQIVEDLLVDVSPADLLIVGHAIQNDFRILMLNNIDIECDEVYCTYENAKRILKRNKELKLEDLCLECGIYPANEHNAYFDTWFTVGVYDFLKNME
mgnify:CR=1 FL=1